MLKRVSYCKFSEDKWPIVNVTTLAVPYPILATVPTPLTHTHTNIPNSHLISSFLGFFLFVCLFVCFCSIHLNMLYTLLVVSQYQY